jgi:hypothetical protein
MEKDKKLDAYYIVGFTDGEGTFNLVKYPNGRIRPQFLLFNTNLEVLEEIKKTLELDCPIFEVVRVNDIIKRRKKCYRLQARSKQDIEKILTFFNKNQPIIKNRDFKIFKECYENWVKSDRNV